MKANSREEKNVILEARLNELLSFDLVPDPYREQSPHFLVKKPQIENKVETKWRQSEDKVETKWRQSEDKIETKKIKSRDKVETQPETKWRQSRDKKNTKTSFSQLVGLQLELVRYIYSLSKIHRHKVSPPISIENLILNCKATKSSIKKSLQRLEEKKVISRPEFKYGRGGWTKYEIENSIFNEIISYENSKVETNWRQSRDKVETKWRQSGDKVETQLETRTSSSSRTILNAKKGGKILATTKDQLPEDWRNIDISPGENFKLGWHHIVDAYNKGEPIGTTAKMVQESIDIVAFEIRVNKKKCSFVKVLMKQLVNGLPVNPSENYKSKSEACLEQWHQRMAIKEEKRVNQLNEIMDFHFKSWWDETAEDEKIKIPRYQKENQSEFMMNMMRAYYEKNIWPEIKKEAGF